MSDADYPKTTVEAHGLSAGYGHGRNISVVVESAEITLHAGDFAVMVGANGAGKSTLLQTLAGILPRLGGEILLDGHDPSAMSPHALARTVAMVFTERVGAGGLTVSEFVALGRQPHTGFFGRLSQADRDAVTLAIDRCGIAHLSNAFMARISDGERQKAMIARALAQQTPIVMLDEPTSFLDVASRIEALDTLATLARETGRTILLSTHDVAPALRMATHVVVLDRFSRTAFTYLPNSQALCDVLNKIFADRNIGFDADSGDFYVI